MTKGKYPPGPVLYKGFAIHARKVAGFPFYYAWVYSESGNSPGVKEEFHEEPLQRDEVIDRIKYRIDEDFYA